MGEEEPKREYKRMKADQIGMLATVMNCIYVSDMFRHVEWKTKIYTPFTCGAFYRAFLKDDGKRICRMCCDFLCRRNRHPYFSTDTATAFARSDYRCHFL